MRMTIRKGRVGMDICYVKYLCSLMVIVIVAIIQSYNLSLIKRTIQPNELGQNVCMRAIK